MGAINNIRVCVCGGSNPATNSEYYNVACEMGKLLSENDCMLIWGGNAHGVLARVYEHYDKTGKPNILFLPEVYKKDLVLPLNTSLYCALCVYRRRGMSVPDTPLQGVTLFVPSTAGAAH